MTTSTPENVCSHYPYTVEIKRIEIRGNAVYELIDRSVHTSPTRQTNSFQSRYLGEAGID